MAGANQSEMQAISMHENLRSMFRCKAALLIEIIYKYTYMYMYVCFPLVMIYS